MADQTDADGRWMVAPTPERAAAEATPFPPFDAGGEWQVRAAVHDLIQAQVTRLAEAHA